MTWLAGRGVIRSYDDYLALPAAVLLDARLLAEHETQREALSRGV